MLIFDKKLNEIKPYKKNPRKNGASVPLVAKSIEEFGFKVPSPTSQATRPYTSSCRPAPMKKEVEDDD